MTLSGRGQAQSVQGLRLSPSFPVAEPFYPTSTKGSFSVFLPAVSALFPVLHRGLSLSLPVAGVSGAAGYRECWPIGIRCHP